MLRAAAPSLPDRRTANSGFPSVSGLLRLCDQVGTPFLPTLLPHLAQGPAVPTQALAAQDIQRISERFVTDCVEQFTGLLDAGR